MDDFIKSPSEIKTEFDKQVLARDDEVQLTQNIAKNFEKIDIIYDIPAAEWLDSLNQWRRNISFFDSECDP